MSVRRRIGKRLRVAGLHVAAAWGLTTFSLVYLAPWTRIAVLPALVTLFFSFPLALLGLLTFWFGTYHEIPGVTWVIFAVMFGAGLLLLGSTFWSSLCPSQRCLRTLPHEIPHKGKYRPPRTPLDAGASAL